MKIEISIEILIQNTNLTREDLRYYLSLIKKSIEEKSDFLKIEIDQYSMCFYHKYDFAIFYEKNNNSKFLPTYHSIERIMLKMFFYTQERHVIDIDIIINYENLNEKKLLALKNHIDEQIYISNNISYYSFNECEILFLYGEGKVILFSSGLSEIYDSSIVDLIIFYNQLETSIHNNKL